MKKLICIFLFVFLSFPMTFATLSSSDRNLVWNAFLKYEKSISNFSTNEQLRRLDSLINSISVLNTKSSTKYPQRTYEILNDFKDLAQSKWNSLNSQYTYVESQGMKNLICEQLGICETNNGDKISNDNYFGNATLEVSVNPFYVKDQVAPASGVISIGKFSFGAVGSDIYLNTINLRREGLGNSSDIRRVYFERNGTKVSNTAGVSSDGYAYISFSPALLINRGATLDLDLMVEMNGSNYGGEHRFAINSSSDVQSQDLPRISGSFPLRTGNLRTTAYSLTTINVYQIYGGTNYSAGRYEVPSGRFSISVPSGQDDYEFKSIKIRNSGDADSSLIGRVGVYKNGQEISSSSYRDGRNITITLYDLLKAGNSTEYEIKIDMITCKGYNEYGYWEDDKYYKCEDLEKEAYKFEIRNVYDVNIEEVRTGLLPKIELK